MKISIDEKQDIFGGYPGCWVTGSRDIQKIQNFLWQNYYGYKFAIVFDCTKDEYGEVKEMPVYFLDDIFNELREYVGKESLKEWMAK